MGEIPTYGSVGGDEILGLVSIPTTHIDREMWERRLPTREAQCAHLGIRPTRALVCSCPFRQLIVNPYSTFSWKRWDRSGTLSGRKIRGALEDPYAVRL